MLLKWADSLSIAVVRDLLVKLNIDVKADADHEIDYFVNQLKSRNAQASYKTEKQCTKAFYDIITQPGQLLHSFTRMLRNNTQNSSEHGYGQSSTSPKAAFTKFMLKMLNVYSVKSKKPVGESAAFVNTPFSDLDREELALLQKMGGWTLKRARDTNKKVKDLVSQVSSDDVSPTTGHHLVQPNQAFTKFFHSFSAHVHGNLTMENFNQHSKTLPLFVTQNVPPQLQECFISLFNDERITLVIELYELIKTFTIKSAIHEFLSTNHLTPEKQSHALRVTLSVQQPACSTSESGASASAVSKKGKKRVSSAQKELELYTNEPEGLVGKTVQHNCESDDGAQWYKGVVKSMKKKKANVLKIEYEIVYSGSEDEVWCMNLLQDLKDGDLVVID